MKYANRGNAGFTLIELIAVIIVVGILAAFTLPRFVGETAFDARGVHDNLASALRYARERAIAGNCPVRVTISSGGYVLEHRSSCGTGAFDQSIVNPGTGDAFAANVAPGVTLEPAATIIFTATGATRGADTTIHVSGGGRTRMLTVIAGTGYVKTQ
jgi:MSHA pilin protein MshC